MVWLPSLDVLACCWRVASGMDCLFVKGALEPGALATCPREDRAGGQRGVDGGHHEQKKGARGRQDRGGRGVCRVSVSCQSRGATAKSWGRRGRESHARRQAPRRRRRCPTSTARFGRRLAPPSPRKSAPSSSPVGLLLSNLCLSQPKTFLAPTDARLFFSLHYEVLSSLLLVALSSLQLPLLLQP